MIDRELHPEIYHAPDNWYQGRSGHYTSRITYRDRLSLGMICQQLGVSKAAAIIRLRHLGYIEDRPYLEFVDPLEVWA